MQQDVVDGLGRDPCAGALHRLGRGLYRPEQHPVEVVATQTDIAREGRGRIHAGIEEWRDHPAPDFQPGFIAFNLCKSRIDYFELHSSGISGVPPASITRETSSHAADPMNSRSHP